MRIALPALLLGLAIAGPRAAIAAPAVPADSSSPAPGEAVAPTTCALIEGAARADHVPVDLLTRLIWQESRFRADALSPRGAQGIAQFMPATGAEQGLLDPFDPETAIPKAAALLADLARRFGNFGLAAAAYNAGPARVAQWLGGAGALPAETQSYVLAVTGRLADDWAAQRTGAAPVAEPIADQSCLAVTADLRAGRAADGAAVTPIAPWGVQLAGSFSKPLALASFERAKERYPAVLGGVRPMVIGAVLRSRGTRPFYRVFVPAATRTEADRICDKLVADGGACVALRT